MGRLRGPAGLGCESGVLIVTSHPLELERGDYGVNVYSPTQKCF